MLPYIHNQERPYHSDSTASRLLSEVKHCRAQLVLQWGTMLESWVLFFCLFTKGGGVVEEWQNLNLRAMCP